MRQGSNPNATGTNPTGAINNRNPPPSVQPALFTLIPIPPGTVFTIPLPPSHSLLLLLLSLQAPGHSFIEGPPPPLKLDLLSFRALPHTASFSFNRAGPATSLSLSRAPPPPSYKQKLLARYGASCLHLSFISRRSTSLSFAIRPSLCRSRASLSRHQLAPRPRCAPS